MLLPAPQTLRQYQWEATIFLLAHIKARCRLLGLNMPTGAGKTHVIMSMLLHGERRVFKAAVIAVPTTPVREQFYKDWNMIPQPEKVPYSTSVVKLQTKRDALFVKTRAKSDVMLYNAVLAGVPKGQPWVFLTTHAQIREDKWAKSLPADLTGVLLVIDEAHHAGTDWLNPKKGTVIGSLTTLWLQRGGTVLYVTATPFRPDGCLVFPAGTKAYVRTAAEHAAEGYAPSKVKVQTVTIESHGTMTPEVFRGEALTIWDSRYGNAFHAMAQRWVAHGMPCATFILPGKHSMRCARMLEEALQAELLKAYGPNHPRRIVNAVGSGAHRKGASKNLIDALQGTLDKDGERHGGEQAVKRYADSKVAAILACRRMDEGVDWPLCSHVYCYGVAGNFGLILQRLGRAWRNKMWLEDDPGIEGYPPEHADTASIVFFVPKVPAERWAAFGKQHHEHAFLLACFAADHATGLALTDELQPRWNRYCKKNPKLAGSKRIEAQQAFVVPTHVRAEMQAIIERFAQEHRAQTLGEPPNRLQVNLHLESLNLTTEQRMAAARLNLEAIARRHPEALDDFEAALPGLLDTSRLSLLSLLEKAIEPYAHQTVRTDIGDGAVAFISEFSAQDAKAVVAHFVSNRGLQLSDADVLRKVMQPYIQRYKTVPNLLSRIQDITDLVGATIPTKLFDVECMLRMRGLDMAKLHACRQWVLGEDIDLALLRMKMKPHLVRLRSFISHAESEWHQSTTTHLRQAQDNPRFDLLRATGLRENLVGLALAGRYGWRGLTPGTRLLNILTEPKETS